MKLAGLLPAGQLPALAAAHPEAYTALIDCCLRSPLLKVTDMLVASQLLQHAVNAVLGSGAALANTAAVAGLASALTSLVKRAMQFNRGAQLQDVSVNTTAAAASINAAQSFAAATAASATCTAATVVLNDGMLPVATAVQPAATACLSSSSSAFLATLLVRSLMQLADAMEAAGPQPLFDSLTAGVQLKVAWYSVGDNTRYWETPLKPQGSEQHHNGGGQWRYWQLLVLRTFVQLLDALRILGVASAAAAAAAAAADAPAGAAIVTPAVTATPPPAGEERAMPSSSTASSRVSDLMVEGSSSSSSSIQRHKWSYLLRLQQVSPQWAAAVAAFDTKWGSYDWAALEQQLFSGTATEASTAQLLYADALQLCRTLTGAAPVTVVCNNPSCENLAGVSEAAASCKACTGCSCRYCSVACQRADWKRHKQACRQLAAAGETCS
jgi:hypothetical protein